MKQTPRQRRSIEKDLFIKATLECVFPALTEKAELERWFAQTAKMDVRPRVAIRFEWAPGMFEVDKIVALESPPATPGKHFHPVLL